jgi:hypothetical protein
LTRAGFFKLVTIHAVGLDELNVGIVITVLAGCVDQTFPENSIGALGTASSIVFSCGGRGWRRSCSLFLEPRAHDKVLGTKKGEGATGTFGRQSGHIRHHFPKYTNLEFGCNHREWLREQIHQWKIGHLCIIQCNRTRELARERERSHEFLTLDASYRQKQDNGDMDAGKYRKQYR